MAKKPEIQYVRQFYVYGSEVQQPKRTAEKKSLLPKLPPERFQKIYIAPVALASVVLAVVMLVFLVTGSLQMRSIRAEYEQVAGRVAELKLENAALSHRYYTGYDPEDIRETAQKLGMIDAEDAERLTVVFSVPQPEKEPSAWDEFVWLLSGLLDNPRRS